jgi:hypothetical protein
MYRIRGADGKEYGPANADQIRQWIREGRVSFTTSAQLEGSTEWKPLSQYEEFAADLNAPPRTIAAPAPTQGQSGNADAIANEVLARGFVVDSGSCVSRSWALVKKNFWLLVGASFVIHLIQGVPLVGALLSGPLYGGLFLLFLKLIRGQRAEFGDAFAGFSDQFVHLLLAGLVAGVLSLIGFLFCIIPGIYLAVAWCFALPLVIDKRLEFWPAMELSRKVVSHHWWQVFWLFVLSFLLSLLGLLACYVGIFVALPVTMGAFAYAYEDIFGTRP